MYISFFCFDIEKGISIWEEIWTKRAWKSYFFHILTFLIIQTFSGKTLVFIVFNLCIMSLLVYHSLLIQQALLIHNNKKKIKKLQENLWRIVNYWCQKSSFFSRIVSCFKNQIAFFANFTCIFLSTWIQKCKLHRWTNRRKLFW